MIYLDNAGTTSVYSQAADTVRRFLTEEYFNASATYKPAFSVRAAVDAARAKIAAFLGAESKEIYFTSCATESNNWAIKNGFRDKNGNMVISAGEHACVYESAKWLESKGLEVRIARLRPDGKVDEDDLLAKTDSKTCLVSVLHVSNETGVINPLKRLSSEVKAINPRALFHSDGVQAFLKTDCNVKALGVDMYSISGHKFHAPKGVGALFIDKKLHLSPFLNGGGQENGLRSGTENVAGIAAMAVAADIFAKNYDREKVYANYKTLTEGLSKIENSFIVGDTTDNTHLIVAVSFPGCRAEILQSMLSDAGVIVGRGSACSSRHSGNRVLEEMKLPKKAVEGTLRISLCPETDSRDIEQACRIIAEKVSLMRGGHIG